jgi:regulator of CtrA degradation|nr:DUF1465 family protein [Neorhizobium tomejilense]
MTAAAIALNDGNELAMKHLRGAVFTALYGAVMAFVEETAAYLDGPGRAESKKLQKMQAYDYANLTRQLTVGTMQVANVLLTLRSVRKGEIPLSSAMFEIKRKSPLDSPEAGVDVRGNIGDQPQGLLALVLKFEELRLAAVNFVGSLETVQEPIDNPVHNALALIGKAFSKT